LNSFLSFFISKLFFLRKDLRTIIEDKEL